GAALSLIMNNLAAAAVLLPATNGAAKRAGVSLSRLLIPLAFGTILGGAATLFTTSNILLSSLLYDRGIGGFGITDFLPVGGAMVFGGIAFITLTARYLLPAESSLERTVAPDSGRSDGDLIEAYRLGEKLFRARVPKNSFLIGKTLAQSTLREDFDVSVIAIERGKIRILAPDAQTVIKSGDTLVLEGDEEDFRRRDVEPYMEYLPEEEWRETDLESQAIEVVEAMLPPRSRLLGKTLRELHFRERYGLAVLAIWRGDRELITDLADVPLRFGDALLLQGPRERLAILRDDPDLILLISPEEVAITVPGRGRAAILIFTATIVFAAIFTDFTATIMLGGALAMMLAGIVPAEQAYSSIGWKSVFLVAGMLPLGIALQKTNASGLFADEIVQAFGPYGPLFLMAGLFISTIGLTQAVNGAVAAAIMGPIAISIAERGGLDPRSMVMAVAIATSMAFITPLSHPVNVMVMSPGGYRFGDYVRIGLPLTIFLFAIVIFVLPIFWPLK
ncbi:MAG: SLC13 family permease, partial [Blastocatellia bacterium]